MEKENRQAGCRIDVLLTRTHEVTMDPFFQEILELLDTEMQKASCVLSKTWIEPFFSDEAACAKTDLAGLVESLSGEAEEKADALIVIGRCNREALLEWKKRYRAAIAINRNSAGGILDEVTCDGGEAAKLAVKRLVELGHHNIAYVGERHGESRFAGYWSMLREAGIPFEETYVFDRKQPLVDADSLVKDLLSLKRPPSGIYCANDITAVSLIKALYGQGEGTYRPSVIASDNIKAGESTNPTLSTVDLRKEEMAHLAITLLLDRLNGGHEGAVRLNLNPAMIDRESAREFAPGEWVQ